MMSTQKFNINNIKTEIIKNTMNCSYCGFCEWVCPTLKAYNIRHYGPRGRVNAIIFAVKDHLWTSESLNSIFSCILCQACTSQCPAGIKIEKIIRLFRLYVQLQKFKVK